MRAIPAIALRRLSRAGATRALALLMSGLVLSACGGIFRSPAAVVNGKEIKQEALEREVRIVLADPRVAQGLGGPQGETRRKDITRQVLAFLIRSEVVSEFARAHGISVSPADVDRALAEAVQQSGGQAAFDRELRRRGIETGEVRGLVMRSLLLSRVMAAVAEERLGDSPALRREYESRKPEFTTVQVAQILLPSKRRALKVRRGVTAANFAATARRVSTDRATARAGGDLGPQELAQLPTPVARAVERLRPGQIAGPVQTGAGWGILLLKRRVVTPFQRAKSRLLEAHQDEVFDPWLAERLTRARIEVNPRFGRFDPRTGEVRPITSTASTP